jgi:hypothetical protein
MFDLSRCAGDARGAFEDTIRFLVQRGEYGPVEDPEEAVRVRVEAARAFVPHYMERQRPTGAGSVEGSPLPQGGWVTVYTDITEVKLQEACCARGPRSCRARCWPMPSGWRRPTAPLAATNAALEEAKRELTEMEARTRLTTEMMPAHIAHVGRDLRYTYSNRG